MLRQTSYRFGRNESWMYARVFQLGFRGTSGFREWLPGVPRNRSNLPGTKFATTVLCSCSNTTVSQLHRVPWPTQTFAEGSVATKRLKNTDVRTHAAFNRGFNASNFNATIWCTAWQNVYDWFHLYCGKCIFIQHQCEAVHCAGCNQWKTFCNKLLSYVRNVLVNSLYSTLQNLVTELHDDHVVETCNSVWLYAGSSIMLASF